MTALKILFHWLVAASAIIIAAYVVPGVTLHGAVTALLLALVLGFLNVFIRPFIILLTLPITILTLGLFTIVINALLVMLAAAILPGFAVSGFWIAVLFSIILALINMIFFSFERDLLYSKKEPK